MTECEACRAGRGVGNMSALGAIVSTNLPLSPPHTPSLRPTHSLGGTPPRHTRQYQLAFTPSPKFRHTAAGGGGCGVGGSRVPSLHDEGQADCFWEYTQGPCTRGHGPVHEHRPLAADLTSAFPQIPGDGG